MANEAISNLLEQKWIIRSTKILNAIAFLQLTITYFCKIFLQFDICIEINCNTTYSPLLFTLSHFFYYLLPVVTKRFFCFLSLIFSFFYYYFSLFHSFLFLFYIIKNLFCFVVLCVLFYCAICPKGTIQSETNVCKIKKKTTTL